MKDSEIDALIALTCDVDWPLDFDGKPNARAIFRAGMLEAARIVEDQDYARSGIVSAQFLANRIREAANEA